jgi:hypothetical protein
MSNMSSMSADGCRVAASRNNKERSLAFLRHQLRTLMARWEFSTVTAPALLTRVPAFSGIEYNRRLRSESRLQRAVADSLTKEELEANRKRLRSEERAENASCVVAGLAYEDFIADKERRLARSAAAYAARDPRSGRVAAFCQQAAGSQAVPTTLFEAAVLREAVDVPAALQAVKQHFPHVSTSALEALLQASGVPATLPVTSAKAKAASSWYRSKHTNFRRGGGAPRH